MKLVLITVGLVAAMLLYFLHDANKIDWFTPGEKKHEKKGKKKKAPEAKTEMNRPGTGDPRVSIVRQWDMPDVLTEISALSYIDENHFACVQDEKGVIFIYNVSNEKIEKEINFAEPGDYEGIAVVANTAYVLRSDGHIFEVAGLNSHGNKVREYSTSLTAKQNVEGMCFDKNNNRLLLAIKDEEAHSQSYKGIYAFNLSDKKFMDNPVLTINLTDKLFENIKTKKAQSVIQPSAISIHPLSADIYVTDGPSSRLLIMGSNGKIKSITELDNKEFPQAEGITFSTTGDMFISNEGSKNKSGNILQVAFRDE